MQGTAEVNVHPENLNAPYLHVFRTASSPTGLNYKPLEESEHKGLGIKTTTGIMISTTIYFAPTRATPLRYRPGATGANAKAGKASSAESANASRYSLR